MTFLSILLAGPSAHAFCGSYVGTAGSDLYNEASEVVLVREGTTTTLSMANDFQGELEEFAMIVPVPVVLTEEDVRVLDPALFDRLDIYSGPRLVSYTCDELYPEPPEFERPESGFGCMSKDYELSAQADTGMMTVDAEETSVEVESQFIVGEYEVVVLSAEDSLDMLQWLSDEGYQVSPNQEELIQEYLDNGSFFFAARVFTDRMPAGQESLSPIQFTYESEGFSLPIRLGTTNSTGSQDLVIYAITSPEKGRLGISNYEEAELESVCLYDESQFEDFGEFYTGRFDLAVDNQPMWVAEYGWLLQNNSNKCDPCPPEIGDDPFPVSDAIALGWGDVDVADTGWRWGVTLPDFYFSRLHVRYTPEQATQDLALYESGINDNIQQRYVQYETYLESEYPICDWGMVTDDPGTCADESKEMRQRMKYYEGESDEGTGGCASADTRWSVVASLGMLSALVVLARRRED
ncbi:MAG: DUF2330 domain-containing protein [Proteobacteria bacterium]|nr:DUF2330 domain-containing protein [Pseudomonadota bacterium]MCP4917552.1 DUF2330 domain-containing protein [Pseudomonadota bacterium]